MTAGRAPFARYRELMRRHGFRPSRKRGQNFLLDPGLHRVIRETSGLQGRDLAVEVGAGLGFLTRALAERAAAVLTAEVDETLVSILRQELDLGSDRPGRVRLWAGDVLEGGRLAPGFQAALEEERAKVAGDVVLAANLPYAVAGPLLAEFAMLAEPPRSGAVLVQFEMAERVAAGPDERAYGALSVLVQTVFEPEVVRRVGREVFRPRPRVDSAVLALRRRPDAAVEPGDRRRFAGLVRALFSFRRKRIRAALRAAGRRWPGWTGLEQALPVEFLEARPDALSVAEWHEIWRIARSFGGSEDLPSYD